MQWIAYRLPHTMQVMRQRSCWPRCNSSGRPAMSRPRFDHIFRREFQQGRSFNHANLSSSFVNWSGRLFLWMYWGRPCFRGLCIMRLCEVLSHILLCSTGHHSNAQSPFEHGLSTHSLWSLNGFQMVLPDLVCVPVVALQLVSPGSVFSL